MSDSVQPDPAGTGAARQRTRDDGGARNQLLAAMVSRMAAGEQEALAHLYDETSSLINGLLLRILERPEDAEEALLDVYMKAWKNAAGFSPERGTVQSWLIIMARSIGIDRIRHKRSQPRTAAFEADNAPEFVSPGATPEETASESQRGSIVRSVIAALAPEQREVLELAYFRGLTHSELAEYLGQPLGTVKSRIRMAMSRMRNLLEKGEAA